MLYLKAVFHRNKVQQSLLNIQFPNIMCTPSLAQCPGLRWVWNLKDARSLTSIRTSGPNIGVYLQSWPSKL